MTEYSVNEVVHQKLLLDGLEGTLQRIADHMQTIRDLYCDPSFPSPEELGDLANASVSLAGSLEAAKETYADDRFPIEDDLATLAQSAGRLATNLQEAAQANAELPQEDE